MQSSRRENLNSKNWDGKLPGYINKRKSYQISEVIMTLRIPNPYPSLDNCDACEKVHSIMVQPQYGHYRMTRRKTKNCCRNPIHGTSPNPATCNGVKTHVMLSLGVSF
ncbi:hypothetical protein CDAR_608881 [Caerostris darwini]|uniref:Uncharacterized protein n=1 Tax=Caerostris darwini TaxID=1538125 RepID=A0AAV4WJ49_9ARAC|nr:hypothetical protein CDAR_608881 [Caerostris darwini]